jgi:polysaccharide biosynthesis transport protein
VTAMPEQTDILRDLLGILYRRRAIVLLALLVTTGAVTIVSLATPPVYEATSTLIADKSPPVVLLSNSGSSSNLFQQPVAQAPDVVTLTELAKSEAVRDAAQTRLARMGDQRKLAGILRGSVRVQQVRSTDLVQISVRNRDPKIAAVVANAVAESVVEMDQSARRRLATGARTFLADQLRLSARALRANESALTAFKNQSHAVALTEETQLNLQRLSGLEQQLTDVRLQQQTAQPVFAEVGNSARQTSQEGPDPVITSLRSQLAALEVEYSGLRKQFTPAHPAVISTRAKIDETQQRLGTEVARRQAALATREQDLSGEIGRIEETLMQVPTRQGILARLTRDAKETERDYLLLAERYQEARIAEGSIGSAVRVVDVAKASSSPVGLKRRLNLAVGTVLGFLLGVAGAYAMEQLDETVKTARDVERLLDAPVLGTAPTLIVGGEAAGQTGEGPPLPLTQLDQGSGAREAFRILRTRVLRNLQSRQSKCLLVTSAEPGEGKSVVIAHLAVSVAQTDRRVWLLECNLRHPTLARFFPEADSPGLSALLSGRTAVDGVARPTTQDRLHCVVAGAEVPDATELLDTQLMTQFLAQARDCADVVLLDGPALGPVADAEVLGLRSDGTLLVVEIGKTTRVALTQARQRLQGLGIPVIGAVLNLARERPAPSREARVFGSRIPWL